MRSIDRERRRIEAAFGAALMAASAVATVEACGSSSGGTSAASDASVGGIDAGEDAMGASDDGGALVDADAASSADVPSCAPTYFILDGATLGEIDAMPDADLCALVEPCGLPPGVATQGCAVLETTQSGTPIPDSSFGCVVSPLEGCVNGVYVPPAGPSAELTCTCDLFIQGGRRTGRVRRRGVARATTPLGAFFASMAREERASIAAFERLGTELSAHGAPAHLVCAAERARRDEARHTTAMARLARRHGGAIDPDETTKARGVRELEAVARENAVEGCVRETFAALLARWQGEHAEDEEVRAAFARIARDEARHAALAWAVAAWSDELLDAGGRRRVRRARAAAVRAVERSLGAEVDATLARRAGIALPRQARVLFASISRSLGAAQPVFWTTKPD